MDGGEWDEVCAGGERQVDDVAPYKQSSPGTKSSASRRLGARATLTLWGASGLIM